jgi:putative selenate reductase molybdopterin-binding subunit
MAIENQSFSFFLNGKKWKGEAEQNQIGLDFLRNMGLKSIKAGCRMGDCGMCTVLLDGKPAKSCLLKVKDLANKTIETVEGLSKDGKLHPIQQAFWETGAVQCGYCTPAQILSAKALLDQNKNPSEVEIRQAIQSVFCRCTGYVRIVDAILRAAAIQRGEKVNPLIPIEIALPNNQENVNLPIDYLRKNISQKPLPPLVLTPRTMSQTSVVGKPELKVDGKKLVEGKPVFTGDIDLDGLLYAALLTSPHPHARIKSIDTSEAENLKGVEAVLTCKNVARIKYASGGQSFPQPLPHDQVCLDDKVRHYGDRVAVVAAETQEIADKAIKLIKVDYEVLPFVIDPVKAMQPGAPIIHDEKNTEGIFDSKRNIVHHIEAEVGEPDLAFAEAEQVFEGDFHTPKQQHAQLEPHICITYLDEDDRLVVRSSTQVPFHVRRIIAPLIGLPVKKIRVIKPRIGGGFGGKQEILLEDLCALLTLKTKRPVKLELTRKQEFTSGRTRHQHLIHYKLGLKDGQINAAELKLIGDTGAYGTHGLTVNMVGGFKGLTLYNAPNSRFICDVVYTNTPPAGAFRGYGAMQEQFAIEILMEEIAEKIGKDVVEFKRDNWLKIGETMHLARKLGEGREGYDQSMATSALDQCLDIGIQATDYYKKRKEYSHQPEQKIKRGIGFSVAIHGSGIAGLDMASASIKMNDDGSFNLQIGATDIGTGSDTILAQIAAEEIGARLEDFIVYSSDTDFTPFDKGAYASSTTFISGGAVRKTARAIRRQILEQAALIFKVQDPDSLKIIDRKVITPDERMLTFADIGLSSLHQLNQHQIMATESHVSYVSPPPTAAQFVEVAVNTETGEIRPERLLMVVDCGRVINPLTAGGQVEGGMVQALGFATSEETYFDGKGQIINSSFRTYKIPNVTDLPPIDVIFIQTDEPSGPFGAKSVSEIAIDGVAPALINAVHNAIGIWFHDLPLTPDKVIKGINK